MRIWFYDARDMFQKYLNRLKEINVYNRKFTEKQIQYHVNQIIKTEHALELIQEFINTLEKAGN